MNNTVAVIIPLYKTHLSSLEEVSLHQCFKVLSKHKIIAVKPQSLSLGQYRYKFDEEISFDNAFFENVAGYNRLLLSPEFYAKFLSYKYILIYQPDALVFNDDLLYWCNKGYDYIGAPWLRPAPYPNIFKEIRGKMKNYFQVKRNTKQRGTDLPTDLQTENRVGNGGFSLRNTARFNELCSQNSELITYYNSRTGYNFNEDVFWGIEVNRKTKQLNIPDYKKAIHFSIENSCQHAFQLTGGKLPFGCHAWDRNFDFWRPVFTAAGIDLNGL